MDIEIVDEFAVGDRVVSIVTHPKGPMNTNPVVAGMIGVVTKIFVSQVNPNRLISDYPFDVIWDNFAPNDTYPMMGNELARLG